MTGTGQNLINRIHNRGMRAVLDGDQMLIIEEIKPEDVQNKLIELKSKYKYIDITDDGDILFFSKPLTKSKVFFEWVVFVVLVAGYAFIAKMIAVSIILTIRQTEIHISNDLIFFVVVATLGGVCVITALAYGVFLAKLADSKTRAWIALFTLIPVFVLDNYAGVHGGTSTILDVVTVIAVLGPILGYKFY